MHNILPHNMAYFPKTTSLPELQRYMQQICEERGWDSGTAERKFLLFTEEVGELAKAIRQHQKLYQENGKKEKFNLEEEFADVLGYILDLANTFEVDLEKAFREKEAVNAKRKWQ